MVIFVSIKLLDMYIFVTAYNPLSFKYKN